MQRLEQRHLTLYCFSFLLLKLSTLLCPFCSARACRLLRQSCADCSRLLQKNGGWRRMAIISAVIALSATQSLWKPASCPTVIADKTQPAERWFIGQFDDLYGNDHLASRNRGWLLLPIVYAFALITWRWRPLCPMNTSPIWKQRRDAGAHWLIAFFLCHANYRCLYALQLAWIDYQLKNKKLAFTRKCRH